MVEGAAPHARPEVTQEGPVGRAGERGEPDCVAEDRWGFGITGDRSTGARDPGVWYSKVCEGVCSFMAAWVREEEKVSDNRQRKREGEVADKVGVAHGVNVVR